MDTKRKALESAVVPAKKSRQELAVSKSGGGALTKAGPARTSNLLAPIMLLSGHEGEIFASKFSPDGSFIASSGFDRQIYLWSVYGECDNFAVLSGAGGAVLDLQFFPDGLSCVAAHSDKNLSVWDLETGVRRKRLRGHTAVVNCCQTARRGVKMVCSGADDGTIKLWDTRKRGEAQTFQNVYQVTSVAFNDTAEQIFTGGIDNDIKVWDVRKNDVLFRMRGHVDTVTGLALSPDGSYLLSNSMDNTVRIYDVRPYVPGERCVKIFQGCQHNFEKNLLRCAWSPDGSKVSAGSADRFVHIWDTTSRRVLYKLPGHAGSVNDVGFHPTEPIIMSAGSDKNIYLGEIEP